MPTVFTRKPDPIQIRQRISGAGQILVWLPALLAVAAIAIESQPDMGSDHTTSFFRPLVEAVFGVMSDPRWNLVHHLIRKTGHFLGYGTVCLTFLRAWLLTFATRPDLSLDTWRLRSAVTAILSTAAVASLDEWHQTTLPNRTGQVSDVLLDTCGATVMVLLVWLILWRRR
jgi:VanZ family protein